jgi:hypothetical protein
VLWAEQVLLVAMAVEEQPRLAGVAAEALAQLDMLLKFLALVMAAMLPAVLVKVLPQEMAAGVAAGLQAALRSVAQVAAVLVF